MDDTEQSRNICQHHKYGYCKFAQSCRKFHVQEICLETHCENRQDCLKRHPKSCRFFSIYQRCKFAEYCAFKHIENTQTKEMEDLKHRLKDFEERDIERKKEI